MSFVCLGVGMRMMSLPRSDARVERVFGATLEQDTGSEPDGPILAAIENYGTTWADRGQPPPEISSEAIRLVTGIELKQ